MGKITIRNISTGYVSLYVPELHVPRELSPGRIIPVSDEEYEALSYDPGFVSLVRGHYIAVDGLEEEKSILEPNEKVYKATDIAKLLDDKDITAFAKFITTATEAERESVVNIAVDKGITNGAIVSLIKKYCDVDIISAINTKHQAEEK